MLYMCVKQQKEVRVKYTYNITRLRYAHASTLHPCFKFCLRTCFTVLRWKGVTALFLKRGGSFLFLYFMISLTGYLMESYAYFVYEEDGAPFLV